MTITRSNPPGWGVGDKLTSSLMNAVDINATNSLDKRAGQTDTLGSVVSWVGAGRMIPTIINGADADTTYTADGGNRIIVATPTADRIYTLGNANAVDGDEIEVVNFANGFKIVVKNAAATELLVLDGGSSGSGSLLGPSWGVFRFHGGAWQRARNPLDIISGVTTFTVGGNYTAPHYTNLVLLVGYGGGAAGASTTFGASGVTAQASVGGGGGGGAEMITTFATVTPDGVTAVTIGAGGASQPAGGFTGTDGSDTTFGTAAIFPGAEGGRPGGTFTTVSGVTCVGRGGRTCRGMPNLSGSGEINFNAGAQYIHPVPSGGEGGYGIGGDASALSTVQGNGSASKRSINATLNTGGAGAAKGTASGAYLGGGGGGGGGGGPGGNGGAGGAGGNANNAGNGANGVTGTAAAANTGAGGGGAGGGGAGSGIGGAGAASGAGGSGKLMVIPIR